MCAFSSALWYTLAQSEENNTVTKTMFEQKNVHVVFWCVLPPHPPDPLRSVHTNWEEATFQHAPLLVSFCLSHLSTLMNCNCAAEHPEAQE